MIDLDAARKKREAASREANKEGPKVVFGGVEYELAPELPFAALEALKGMTREETAAGALAGMVEGILGEHYQAWLDCDPPPSLDDVNELVGGVMAEYGIASPLPLSAS